MALMSQDFCDKFVSMSSKMKIKQNWIDVFSGTDLLRNMGT